MTETKRGPGRPRKETPEEIAEREDLETMFADVSQTYTVKVYRTDPEWATGYMGKFHVSGGRTLTLDEIKNRFGGRVFDLRVYTGSKPGVTSRRTVEIDDIPRREGFEVYRDGTTASPHENRQQEQAPQGITPDPFDEILNMPGTPPAMKKRLMLLQLGLGQLDQPQQQLPNMQAQMQAQMQMQQAMNEMMNQSRQSQMQMQQQQFEMTKQMMQFKQEIEKSNKPENALGEVDNVVKMIRELNGIKTELGGGDEPLTAQILSQTMPMVETALSEYLALKKVQAQNELKQAQFNAQAAPALPQRVAPPKVLTALPNGEPSPAPPSADDPVAMAEKMAETYASLDPESQRAVMGAFLAKIEEKEQSESEEHENIEHNTVNGTIGDVKADILDDEDRAILNAENQNKTGDVPDREHAGTIEKDDPPDRESDPGGVFIPSD